MKAYQRFKWDNVIAGLTLCAVGFGTAYLMRDSQAKTQKRSEIATPPGAQVAYTTSLPEGDLMQITIHHDPLELGLIEVQTCWVWRDAKLSTASLSCPTPSTISADTP